MTQEDLLPIDQTERLNYLAAQEQVQEIWEKALAACTNERFKQKLSTLK